MPDIRLAGIRLTVARIACVLSCLTLAVGLVAHEPLTAALGGPGWSHARKNEQQMKRLRTKQAVLARREEILRYQLRVLEEEYKRSRRDRSATTQKQLRESRNALVLLLRDQRQTDDTIVEYLRQLWEAEGRARVASLGATAPTQIVLSWPVEPDEGISAGFHDEGYEEHFGIKHEGIDIPIDQGSIVHAAADGTVDKVVDNGLGYSYIILKHEGYATLYGHMSQFLVKEGDTVVAGDPIAASGGRPGTKGSGPMTTGPHLHFELTIGGAHVDARFYLPFRENIED